MVYSKIRAFYQLTHLGISNLLNLGPAAGASGFFQLSHLKSLFYMQLTKIAILIPASIVVYAVGGICILLDLYHHNASTYGMKSTRRYIKAITLMYLHHIADLHKSIILYALTEFLLAYLAFKSIHQGSPRLAFSNVPELILRRLISVLASEKSIRVHLERQILICIQNLDQQWELIKELSLLAEDPIPHPEQILSHGKPGIWSVQHLAHAIMAASQLPALCH